MGFPEPDDDTVAKSARVLMKVKYDERVRAQRRATLARETGYAMFAPGMF